MFSFFQKTNLVNKAINYKLHYYIHAINNNIEVPNNTNFLDNKKIKIIIKLLKKECYSRMFTSKTTIYIDYKDLNENPDFFNYIETYCVIIHCENIKEICFENIKTDILLVDNYSCYRINPIECEKIKFKKNVNIKELELRRFHFLKEIHSDKLIKCNGKITNSKFNKLKLKTNNVKIKWT